MAATNEYMLQLLQQLQGQPMTPVGVAPTMPMLRIPMAGAAPQTPVMPSPVPQAPAAVQQMAPQTPDPMNDPNVIKIKQHLAAFPPEQVEAEKERLAAKGAATGQSPTGGGIEGATGDASKNTWMNFINQITGDTPAAFMLNAGINMLQPRQPGQSQLGHIGASLGASIDTLKKNRAAAAAAGLEGRKVGATEKSVQTEAGLAKVKEENIKADTAARQDETTLKAELAKPMMLAEIDLKKAQAEHYRYQSQATSGDAESRKAADVQLVNLYANSLLKTRPDLYKNLDEAIVAAAQLNMQSGLSPEDRLNISVGENLAYLTPEKRKLIEGMGLAMGQLKSGPTAILERQQKANEANIPSIPVETWKGWMNLKPEEKEAMISYLGEKKVKELVISSGGVYK